MGAKRKPRANAFTTLVGYHGITEAQQKKIDDLLMAGTSPWMVSRTIREEWGLATSISINALLQKVILYRDRVLGKGIIMAAQVMNTETREEIKKAIDEQLNVVAEMNTIILTQKARVTKLLEKEKGLPVLLKDATENIRILGTMLEKMAGLQMDVGLLKRVPKEVDVAIDVSKEEFEFMERAKSVESKAHVYKGMLSYVREMGVMDVEIESDPNLPS